MFNRDTLLNKNTIGWTVFALLGSVALYVFWIVVVKHTYNWDAIKPYTRNMFSGWLYTLIVSLFSLVLSIVVGFFLTIGQMVSFKPARILSRSYVELVRGMPLLVLILIGYYMIADSIDLDNQLVFGVLLLSLFTGTYLSEIFRAGVESIAKSQWQSARAIGLDSLQTYRLIVIPQAIRRVLPASAGQFANLIKDSSLLYVVAVPELMSQSRQANSNAYTSYEGYIPMAIGYLLLTLPIFFWSRHLEKKFGFDQ